jgi:GT2 family glycosyltransferase
MSIDLNPSVTCVLLNWNGGRDTVACLDALRKSIYPNMRIVVVDNGSVDDSVARIRRAHPSLSILESDRNLGFAGGNNIGIRYALAHGSQYVWLLNNDTEPAPDALSELVARMEKDPHTGAAASICYFMDAPEAVQVWAGTQVNLWIGYARNATTPQTDDWFQSLYGASLLISGEALRDAGLLDEGFFLYWEETEFCLRLRKCGWRLVAAPGSRVLHHVNASTSGNSSARDRYFTASGLRILRLHSPAPVISMLLFLSARLARRLMRLQFSSLACVLAGLRDYLRSLPMTQSIR